MISVINNRIKMPRGDTFMTKVLIKRKDGSEYIPQEGDLIRFALKHPEMKPDGSDFIDTEPLILKEIPNDTQILRLDPADTKGLGFGEYVYDIEITKADGTVDTFIEDAEFTLKREVH